MALPDDQQRFERDIEDLKASVDKYLTGTTQLTDDAARDLARAIHDMGDHLVDLHRRVEASRDSHDEWTTHGWEPPPGTDRPY
jgi:hypothetical protein